MKESWWCTIVKDKNDGVLDVNLYKHTRKHFASNIDGVIKYVDKQLPTKGCRIRMRVIGTDDGSHSCLWLSANVKAYPFDTSSEGRNFKHIGYYAPAKIPELVRTYLEMLP